MSSLYNLTNDFLEVAKQLEEMELDEQTFQDTLEAYQSSIEDKAENIIKFTKHLQAMSEARKAESERLAELAATDSKKADKLLAYLDESLQKIGKTKLTAGVFELKYKKGSKIVVVDETRLPDEYFVKETIKKAWSKPLLAAKLKEGGKIPGVKIITNPDKLVIK